MKRSRILWLAGLAVAGFGAAAGLTYLVAPEPAETAAVESPAPRAEARPAAEPAPSAAETAAALSAKPDPNPDRRLMGVFRSEPKERSRAFVALKGQVASYALGDKLPPDDAALTKIEERYVLLQPPVGGPLLLALESTGTNQVYEPAPLPRERHPLLGMNILEGWNGENNPVKRLLGGRDPLLRQRQQARSASTAPSRPPPKPAAAGSADEEDDEDFDPYASCEQLASSDEQIACEDRIDEEIERLEETCDEIEDVDAWDLCTEAANRMAPTNTAGTGATPPTE